MRVIISACIFMSSFPFNQWYECRLLRAACVVPVVNRVPDYFLCTCTGLGDIVFTGCVRRQRVGAYKCGASVCEIENVGVFVSPCSQDDRQYIRMAFDANVRRGYPDGC